MCGGCYLNIGEQHLVCSEGYFFFALHKRLGSGELPGSYSPRPRPS
jgi:hypothetical protein